MSTEQAGKEHFGDWAELMGIKIIPTLPSKTAPVKPYDAQHAELVPEPKWWQVGFKIMAVDKAEWKALHDLDVSARCEEYTCRHLSFLHEDVDGRHMCRVCLGVCDYEKVD